MNLKTLRLKELRVVSAFLLDLYEPVPAEAFARHVGTVCARYLQATAASAVLAATLGANGARLAVRPRSEATRTLVALLVPHVERARAMARRRDAEALPVAALVRLGLTPREAETLHWAARGKGDEEIAIILGVAYRTVCKNMERIRAKLGVEGRVAAVNAAREALRA